MKRPPRSLESAQRLDRQMALRRLGFAISTHRVLWLLASLTFVLSSLIFAPINLWPLAFVCLVPWCIMIGAATRAPLVYYYSYLLGLIFFFWNLRWLYPSTGVGYVALSVYLAVYFPLIACPVRHAIRRRRMPLGVVLPLVWVGSEMVRAVVISGFPWFYLAHSQYKVLTLIQISDLVGAYGVSFLVAAINGLVADVILAAIAKRRASLPGSNIRRARFSAVFCAVLLLGTIVYGQIQLRRNVTAPGPRIATIQGDFLDSVAGFEGTRRGRMETYLSMMDAAAAEQPDLYLLPESAWGARLNPEVRNFDRLSRESFARLQAFATTHNATVVVGSMTQIPTPMDLIASEHRYNSATVFTANGAEPERYDKIHLVYFGEIVPFRQGRFRFLYFWLNSLMPFSDGGRFEYSIFPGSEFRSFELIAPSLGNKRFRFATPICYEDVMPYVSRAFVLGDDGNKAVDLLLNISNDGWFGRGTQQPQHLAISVFRAVENRVPVVRSVNTGDSGFIASSGRLHHLLTGDHATPWPGNSGFEVAQVEVDSRLSFYSRHGDWFAWTCAVLWLLFYLDYTVVRMRTPSDG